MKILQIWIDSPDNFRRSKFLFFKTAVFGQFYGQFSVVNFGKKCDFPENDHRESRTVGHTVSRTQNLAMPKDWQ